MIPDYEINEFSVSDEMMYVSDGADWTLTGRLFQSRGPACRHGQKSGGCCGSFHGGSWVPI